MLKYDEFKQIVIAEMQKHFKAEEYEVRIEKVKKVNITLDGMFVLAKNKTSYATPVVYIEMLYDYYCSDCCNGNVDIAVKAAIGIIEETYLDISVDKIEAENIKNNVVMVLVNADKNKELLSNVPYIEFLDLAIVFRWIVNKGNKGISSVIVNNEIAENAKLDKEQLFELAKENTKRLLPVVFEPLGCTIKKLAGDKITEEDAESVPLFLLSNDIVVEGAASMVYTDVLERIRNVMGDFYVLPSSVNEVLIVKKGTVAIQFLKNALKEVNRTVVGSEDWLSDNVYLFDGEMRIV